MTSASKISGAQQDAIASALRERLGREVSIETKIDENLIGGAVTQIGSMVYDGSLRTQLESLRREMAQE